jgi:hypothetical protein
VQRRARDATVGLTVTRIVDARRVGQLRRHAVSVRDALSPPIGRRRDRRRVGAAVPARTGDPGAPDPPRPRVSSARSPTPRAAPGARRPSDDHVGHLPVSRCRAGPGD